MGSRFWEDEPEAPYATLLRMVETYCHPEAWEGAYGQLQALARRMDDRVMRVFKQELRAVIGDPSLLPEGSLRIAVEYADGSASAFLARLWRDLYPAEPSPLD